MYGKIIDGRLQIAGKRIKNGMGGEITNPTIEDLIANGYKGLCYNPKPDYDKEEEKLIETYTEEEVRIVISYEKVALTDEEHNEIIKQEIEEEENKITKRRQREIDLDKEGARDFEQEVENNIVALRAKLRPVGEEQEQ